jgi:xylulose-5-phosphate/fructose-6-phosphate phosphoketolase
MTVLNDLDRFHLGLDSMDRLSRLGAKGIHLKQEFRDKLVEHKVK